MAPRFLGKLCTSGLDVIFWFIAGRTKNEHEGSNAGWLKSVFGPDPYGLSGPNLGLLPTCHLASEDVIRLLHEPRQYDARIHFEIFSRSDGVINRHGCCKSSGSKGLSNRLEVALTAGIQTRVSR